MYIYMYKKFIFSMANYSKKLLQFIYDKWDKYPIIKNTNQMIENVKEKAKTQISNNVTNSSVLKELRTISSEPLKPLPQRLVHWWQWYQYIVGLNTVEKARQEVILLQHKLAKCRDMRHGLHHEAFMINTKKQTLYDELLMTRRDDPKYVTLTISENKTLQEQNKNTEKLNLLEEEEKNYFLQLTTAINEYQDAQSLNAQKYKYLSILASVTAALLSLITSMIYNNQRINKIKEGISEMQERSESIIVNRCNALEQYIGKNLLKPFYPDKTEPQNEWLVLIRTTVYVFGAYLIIKGICS